MTMGMKLLMYNKTKGVDMKLNELLKVNSVRCINTKVYENLVEGEIYKVEGFDDETIKIVNSKGFSSWHNKNLFEPVINNDVSKSDNEIDISLNSVDDVNTTFKVGDKVYKYGETDVKTVLEVFEYGYMQISNYPHRVNREPICYATQENYEMLCKLYPHIQFELPPKEITRSDLTKGMFERGTFAVVCKCSDTSEIMAIAMSPLRLIVGYSDGYFEENNGKFWKFAIPYDPKTNLPLTEDVLNEKI